MTDRAASVLAKLKNHARAAGISYQQCLQLFFQEEFLRRLSASSYTENFVLKGGLLIYTLTHFESRATVDVDLLMQGLNNDLSHMDAIISEILAVPTENDYIVLEASPARAIALQRRYHGLCVPILGRIKQVRVPFHVDIGVGDAVAPAPQRRRLETQLDGFQAPDVLTYPLESTIAEKLDAILQRFELTGRMKDFYDIYYLSRQFDFTGAALQDAIALTLRTRGTPWQADSLTRMLALAQDAGMQRKWRYFLRSLGGVGPDFSSVMEDLERFLQPVWNALVAGQTLGQTWCAAQQTWC